MNRGSKVVVTNGEFTGVEGTFERAYGLDGSIYSDIHVNSMNPPIRVPFEFIQEVTELDG